MPQAFFRFRAEFVRRGPGRGMKSALVAAAYRSGQKLHFHREDLIIDYTRRRGVLVEGILAPDLAPQWALDREALWNAVEANEKHSSARLARDFTLALPHQLTEAQMEEAVRGFLQTTFVALGLVCDFALHAPAGDDKRNFHAHCLVTERAVTASGFAANKDRKLNQFGKIDEWRAGWAAEINQVFKQHAIRDAQSDLYWVDHRSYRERGTDQEPGIHLGPAASELERQGIATEAGNVNRAVGLRNQRRAQFKTALAQVEQLIATEQNAIGSLQPRPAVVLAHAETMVRRRAERTVAPMAMVEDLPRATPGQMPDNNTPVPQRRQAAQPAGRQQLNTDLARATNAAHAEERRRPNSRPAFDYHI